MLNKDCQKKAWKSGHMGVCENGENLLRLTALPSLPFKEDYFMFRSDIESGVHDCDNTTVRLPPYVPKVKVKETPTAVPQRVLG